MLAKILAEKAVQVKVNANREEPLLEKKAAMLKRTLQRAQNSKLDLYEEYRNGLFLYLTVEEERFLEELAQMLEPDKKLRMQSIINRFSMPKIRT